MTTKKKKEPETTQETLIRRLREYIEYAENTKRFSDVGFYEELIDYIKGRDETTK